MYHPTIRGTYYDMGLKYGTVLYKHGFRVTEQPAEKLEFGKKSEKEVRRVFPEILEEIKGFAEGCHAQYEHLAAFMMGIGAFKAEPMCSAFAAASGSDVVIGRNYDFFYSFKKFTESYLTLPEGGYTSLGHSDVFIGREDGINEKGLAIAITGVHGKTEKPGVSFCLATRATLDKCANVQEAVRLLTDTRPTAAFNFLLADKEGGMAVVEASPDRTRVRKPEKDESFVFCTNHFVHPEMQEMENLEGRKASNWDTLPRYATMQNALKEHNGKTTVKHAQEILSNHTGYVCSHQEKIKLGTLWSIVATLKEPKILRAEGQPCRTRYKQDLRLNKAIKKNVILTENKEKKQRHQQGTRQV